jgi:hypothetical protein
MPCGFGVDLAILGLKEVFFVVAEKLTKLHSKSLASSPKIFSRSLHTRDSLSYWQHPAAQLTNAPCTMLPKTQIIRMYLRQFFQ